MKNKIVIVSALCSVLLGIYSFKNISKGEEPNIILVSGNTNSGLIITYGDGKKEVREFKKKVKVMNTETYDNAQIELAILLEEFRQKGYHYVGSHTFLNSVLILEKK